jgi:dipeptidyl-peptidase-4
MWPLRGYGALFVPLAVVLCCAVGQTEAQERALTSADYARAEQLLSWNAKKLVRNLDVEPHWIEQSERCWFKNETAEGKEFLVLDAEKGTTEPAFDHARLASALSKAAGITATEKAYSAKKLPFEAFTFTSGGAAIEFNVEKDKWACELRGYTCAKSKPETAASGAEVVSPDKKWAISVKQHNLFLRPMGTKREFPLTTDGKQYDEYAVLPDSNTSAVSSRILLGKDKPIAVVWSPDSKKVVTYKLDQTKVREAYLVQSVAPGEIGAPRPVLYSYRYPFPGDKNVALLKYVIFDVTSKAKTAVNLPAQETNGFTAFDFHAVWWEKDGKSIYFLTQDRPNRTLKLNMADAVTGTVRTLVEEHGTTQVEPTPEFGSAPIVKVLDGGAKVVWFSERDGWGHLYLYDGKTGKLKNQITKGDWLVRGIERVDEEGGWIYFSAAGREKGEDPYLRHLYRVRLDGTGLELLTKESGDHSVRFSASGKYFFDAYSRVDAPPVFVLRAADGRVLREVAKADVTELLARGYTMPEAFEAKAADGVTDVYGLLYKPAHFDATKEYPVLDSIYPGPQHGRVAKTFEEGCVDVYGQAPAMAQLGFVVITVDGRGTPLRSKAFHDDSYGKLGDAGGLEDHVAAIKSLAELGYLDLTRVGMYGHSGGGYATVRAMLRYPDFYKVGVSSSGEHDMRGYLAGWGEKYEGPLDGESYVEASNPALVLSARLKGKLLIAWGDMDDNVPPALELQLVHSLIATNQDFDTLVLPNRNHSLYHDPYFMRRLWDYLVRNLMGAEPPAGYEIKSADPAYQTLDGKKEETKKAEK